MHAAYIAISHFDGNTEGSRTHYMLCRYVHGDIKPENFLMGQKDTPQQRKLYLVDLGLTQRYLSPNDGSHVPYRQIPNDFRYGFSQELCGLADSSESLNALHLPRPPWRQGIQRHHYLAARNGKSSVMG